MTCSDTWPTITETYALGVLDEPELSEAAGAPGPQLRRLHSQRTPRGADVGFFGSEPDVELPKDLRGRVLTSASCRISGWNWMQTWATVAGCVLLGVFWFEHLRSERVRAMAPLRRRCRRPSRPTPNPRN